MSSIRAYAVASIVIGVGSLLLIAAALSGLFGILPEWLRLAVRSSSNAASVISSVGQEYTVVGSYSWTVPSGVTEVTVTVVGGGQGGGTGQGPSSGDGCDCFTGNGGTAGRVTTGTFAVLPGDTYAVVVGGGGAGASPTYSGCTSGGYWNGSNGGTSSFVGPSGTILLSAAGSGGGNGQGGGLTTSIGRTASNGGTNGTGYGSGGVGASCNGAGGAGARGAVLISYDQTFDVDINTNPSEVLQGSASTVTWSAGDPAVVAGSPSAAYASSGTAVNNLVATAAAEPGNGYRYYYGGRISTGATTNIIYRAPVNNPAAIADSGARLPTAMRSMIPLVPGDGYIYLIGGLNGSNAYQRTIYRAPVSNPTSVVATGALFPIPISVASTGIGEDGYAYILGGVTTGGATSNKIYRASLSAMTSWADTGAVISNGGTAQAWIAGSDGYLYLYGGLRTTCAVYDSTATKYYYTCYDPNIYRASASNPLSWSDTGINMPNYPRGIGEFGLITPGDGFVYLAGGYQYLITQTWNGSSWVSSLTFTTYADVYRAPLSSPAELVLYGSLPAARANIQMAATPSAVYVIGGRIVSGSTPTITYYNNVYRAGRTSVCSVNGPGLSSTAQNGSQATGALTTLGQNIYSFVCNLIGGDSLNGEATVTVWANRVLVSSSDTTASEEGPDTATFVIGRVGSTAAALPVMFTLSGTLPSDYTLSTSTTLVTIPAGVASTTIVLTPVDDSFVEDTESVTLTLQSGTYMIADDPWNTQIVTITDNDEEQTAPVLTGALQVYCISGGVPSSTCRIRAGSKPYLSWNATNIMVGQTCALTSSSDAQTDLPSQAGSAGGATFSATNYQPPAPITEATTFTLNCSELPSSTVTVTLVPAFEEI